MLNEKNADLSFRPSGCPDCTVKNYRGTGLAGYPKKGGDVK
jgi:hypothetical protein